VGSSPVVVHYACERLDRAEIPRRMGHPALRSSATRLTVIGFSEMRSLVRTRPYGLEVLQGGAKLVIEMPLSGASEMIEPTSSSI